MKVAIYFAIFWLIENAVDAGPVECHACIEKDAVTCSANQVKQTCATDPNSLGTTHCGSMAIKYYNQSGSVVEGFVRGCINCLGPGLDRIPACFTLGGALKARKMWTLKKCEIECCTENNCNNQTTTLSENAVIVHYNPDAVGAKHYCYACRERDYSTCNANQHNHTCTADPESIGTKHCYSAKIKYRDMSGNVQVDFVRGCADCISNLGNRVCYALGGYLRVRKKQIVEVCKAECCQGANCNKDHLYELYVTLSFPVFLRTAECNTCVGSDAASCNRHQTTQYCAKTWSPNWDLMTDIHCASAVVTYRKRSGYNVYDGFYRGCIDCRDEQTACDAVASVLRQQQDWYVQQCEVTCCSGNNCNTQNPTLPYTTTANAGSRTSTFKGIKPTDAPGTNATSGQDNQHALFSSGTLTLILAFAHIVYLQV